MFCTLACFVSNGPRGTHPSMIVFKVPPVIPTRGLWIVMMFLNGIIGMAGQVCPSLPSSPIESDPCILNRERPSWPWVFKGKLLHAAPLLCIPQCVFSVMCHFRVRNASTVFRSCLPFFSSLSFSIRRLPRSLSQGRSLS